MPCFLMWLVWQDHGVSEARSLFWSPVNQAILGDERAVAATLPELLRQRRLILAQLMSPGLASIPEAGRFWEYQGL